VEDYYEEFERIYDERYQQQYGPWRKVIGEVMRKYLECGDLHRGFARLACGCCRYQTILSFSSVVLPEFSPSRHCIPHGHRVVPGLFWADCITNIDLRNLQREDLTELAEAPDIFADHSYAELTGQVFARLPNPHTLQIMLPTRGRAQRRIIPRLIAVVTASVLSLTPSLSRM
jgi:hypothetical protein